MFLFYCRGGSGGQVHGVRDGPEEPATPGPRRRQGGEGQGEVGRPHEDQQGSLQLKHVRL